MFCDVEMQNPPPIVAQNDQHKKDSQGRGWNCEGIKRDYFLAMVLEKRPPRLRWRPTALDHVLRDRCLGDLDPEFLQFPVNSRGTPERIGPAHTPNQVPDLRINPWSSAATTLPAPVVSEALPVPADNRTKLNDMQGPLPSRSNLRQYYPK